MNSRVQAAWILVLLLFGFVATSVAMTLEERITYQRAVEEVYWQHRLWPPENPNAKPELAQVLSFSDIQAKVEDTLRKSNALEKFYNRPITAEQLQREMERMATQTKQPEMLRELWAALDNDPSVIAEVLARPILVDRLLRDWYSIDERVHGKLKSKAESELKIHGVSNDLRQLGGDYVEVEWVKRNDDSTLPSTTNQIALTDSEWNQTIAPLKDLPVGKRTALQEDQTRFFVMAVLHKGTDWMKVAMVEWKKQPFESWWKDQAIQVSPQTADLFFEFQLPEILATTCAQNSWDPMRSIPSSRGRSVWTGSELIVWGKLFTQFSGGRYSPVTDSWHPISGVNEPSPRSGATAVWTGTQMIVWGGWGGGVMNNVFNTGGRYNPISDSWLPTSTGLNVPSKRQSHTAVWTGQEMIIWGGLGDAIQFNSGGRYNPVSDSWIPTSLVNAPLERAGHLAVWTGNEMIVWGGVNGFTYNYLVSGARYNPASDSWIATTTTGAPVARHSTTAVWTGSEMIVWGGRDPYGFVFMNSGARYRPSTNQWTPTASLNAPFGRYSHSAVWTGTEMIVWGGCTNHDCTYQTSTGARYNPVSNSWIPTSLLNVPSDRASHSAQWTGSEMIIWGGCTGGECKITLSTGARYRPQTDTWITMSSEDAAAGRINHSAIWTGSEMLIWGGFDNYLNSSGSRYDPATDHWTSFSWLPGTPNGRDGHSTVWTGTEMIVWGGRAFGMGNTVTGGKFNPTTSTWTDTSWTGTPSARAFHSGVWSGTEMIVWGGCMDESCAYLLNDGGRYNPATNSWKSMSSIGAPSARFANTAVFAGNQMIIWGGVTGANFASTNTGARYVPSTDQWVAMSLTGAPGNRYVHSAVWTGTQMIVWGGTDGTNVFNNGARYSPALNTWTAVSTVAAPSPRRQHSAIWTGSEMVLWGGCSDAACNGVLFSGGHYNPATNIWVPTALKSAPSNRSNHTAVWSGTQMLVWGGWINGSGTMLKTGGRYCISGTSDFSISGNPTSLSVAQGTSSNVATTVTSFNGFNSGVTLSCSGIPAGITCGFAVNPLTPPANGSANTNLTVNVSAGTAAGTYNFQVKGISGTLTHTFNLQVTVLSTPQVILTSLTLNPTTVIGTNNAQGTVLLSGAAPAGGVTVSLTSSNSVRASVPTSVTIPAGSTSKTFTITTSTPSVSTPVTIFASYNGVTKNSVLTVTTDTLAIQVARYRKPVRTLTVEATSNNPNPTTLRVYQTSTNAYIGTLVSVGGGKYTGNFTLPQNPQSIKVQSILGGSATKVVTTK